MKAVSFSLSSSERWAASTSRLDRS